MSCGWTWYRTCETNSCDPCAKRKKRRLIRVVDGGMQAQLGDGRSLWLLTLTAPGSRDHKRWTPAQVYVRGAARPPCECHRADPESLVQLADWNPDASACWNRLRTALTRLYGDLPFYRAAEVQDGSRASEGIGRGAVHHHVIIAMATTPDPLAIQALALAAGYGCVTDLQAIRIGDDVSDLAAYVSKTLAGYVSKSANDRQEVPWRKYIYADKKTGEIFDRVMHTAPTYRTHSQSADWGCTIKQVKAHNQMQARARAETLALIAAEMLTSQGDLTLASAGVEPSPD